MNGNGTFAILVGPSEAGERLDAVITRHVADVSRSMINGLIRREAITVGGKPMKPGYRVRSGDDIRGRIPPPEPLACRAEPIPIDVLYEDGHIIVVNKPHGLVVHPAAGNTSGTLVNALLCHCPDLGVIGDAIRPGIVHRLDKDTSGTLVVAKTASAHRSLSEQFKSRSVKKTYVALVYGQPAADSGTVSLPIGRHPVDRKRMSTVSRRGREAMTLWRVKQRFTQAALLEVDIKTGRTHQIRVHLASVGFPVVGDAVYGKRKAADRHWRNQTVSDLLKPVQRQMLHARRLELMHPATGEKMVFVSPLPPDMTALIDSLKSAHPHDSGSIPAPSTCKDR